MTLYGLTFFRECFTHCFCVQRICLQHCSVETYIYYTRFPHDARETKYTVSIVVLHTRLAGCLIALQLQVGLLW